MIIREYTETDLAAVERIDSFCALQIRYHKGVVSENIVCAAEGETLVGVGFLILLHTIDTAKKQKVSFSINIDSTHPENRELFGLLLDGLLQRFHDLKTRFPSQTFCMQAFFEPDEIQDMQFLLNKGFGMRSVIPVHKYDLTNQTVHYAIPSDIKIQRLQFDQTTMKQYLDADAEASSELESEADIWFNTGNPNFACYAATCNGEVVGSISVWNIMDERAATENIFVVPAFRRKNIARELIATAFDVLKERNMKIATLTVDGMNMNAIRLYLSCGYELYYNLIKMVYE